MYKLYQTIFDSARGPLGKIAAATLIGAVIAAFAAAKEGDHLQASIPKMAAAGAAMGFASALILVLADRFKENILGLVLVGLLGLGLCVGICLFVMTLLHLKW